MTQEDPRLIEEPVRQSQSQLWKIQRNYFTNMGIRAWKEEVPFYISSNAYTCHQYAYLAVKYLIDWFRLHPNQKEPICYLLEVGSGTGKFSFYFLKAFKALLAEHNTQIKFCYIMSDFVENNLRFCQDNLSFKPYLDNNELDFACYNIEEETDFQLKLSKKKFSDLKRDLPLIVIANYTLDCIAQDEFEYKNGKFYEVRLGLRSRYKYYDVNKGMYLNELRFVQDKIELNSVDHYYDNPQLNEILLNYPSFFVNKQSRISMPIGGFRFLDNLKSLTNQSYFLIVGDKGTTIPSRFPLYGEKRRYTFDGCYSFSVNLHALGEYVKKAGGDYLLTENSNEFKVNLYTMGFKFTDLLETKTYFKQSVAVVGPEEFCYIFDEYTTSSYRFSLKSLFAFIRFSQWDPNVYGIVHDQVIDQLPNATAQFTEDMKDDMNKVIANLYRINIGEDIFNLAGMFFQIQEENDKALELYQQSIEVFGDKSPAHNNIAMIYEDQKNIPKAIYHFQKAVSFNKNNRLAKRKLYTLTGKPHLALIAPIIKGILVLVLIFGAIYLITRK